VVFVLWVFRLLNGLLHLNPRHSGACSTDAQIGSAHPCITPVRFGELAGQGIILLAFLFMKSLIQ